MSLCGARNGLGPYFNSVSGAPLGPCAARVSTGDDTRPAFAGENSPSPIHYNKIREPARSEGRACEWLVPFFTGTSSLRAQGKKKKH
jgi:hypothetical protein